jgi:hypothetical protein
MSDPASDSTVARLSAQIEDVSRAFRRILGCSLILMSVPNFVLSLSTFYLAQVLQGELPGKPQPPITEAIMSHPFFILSLAFVWPILGALNLSGAKRIKCWSAGTVILWLAIGIQILCISFAWMLPHNLEPTGISDFPAK